MSVSVNPRVAGGPIIKAADVSLKGVIPGGKVNTDAEFRASKIGLGADINNVRHAVTNGLESLTMDVDCDWTLERVGGQDAKLKISEKIDTTGKLTGTKGQLYVSMEMYAKKDGKLLDRFNCTVSPAANGTIQLSRIGCSAQKFTIGAGKITVLGTPLGAISGKIHLK